MLSAWQRRRYTILMTAALAFACSAVNSHADCLAENSWFPTTPLPDFATPAPHPAPDCGFYKPAWQLFLNVTQPNSSGSPAFLSYSSISDVFGQPAAFRFAASKVGFLSLAPRNLKGSNNPINDLVASPLPMKSTVVNAGARQAGLNGLLVDQRGSPVFYAIHMNSVYADFIRQNRLTTKAGIDAASSDLEFPTGTVELKSAWQIVPDGVDAKNYITTRALVPVLRKVNGLVDVDETVPPRQVTVALLALHVVFVLKNHPEFIWSTFEHIDKSNSQPDLAPRASGLPSGDEGFPNGVDGPVSSRDYILYKAGTPASRSGSNAIPSESDLVAAFDSTSQTFTSGGKQFQTSVYRRYPGSKLRDVGADDEVSSINKSIQTMFGVDDPRSNYQLVGAVWLDKPQTFKADMPIANPPGVDPDDVSRGVVAGEDGLSSMAMESFTQDSFVNCFSCHDTRKVTNFLNTKTLMQPKRLNVSHILSKFIDEAP